MIGTLLGDVIGSPYKSENIQDLAGFIGWNLFEDNTRIYFYDKAQKRISQEEFNALPKEEQAKYKFRMFTHKPCSTIVSSEATEVSSYMLGRDSGEPIPESLTSGIPIGVAAGEYARTADEAVKIAQDIARHNQLPSYGLRDSIVCAHASWMLSHGYTTQQAVKVVTDVYGLKMHSEEEMGMLLKGMLRESDGKLEIGDGHKPSELSIILPAALHCVSISRSYEEAVRRAAAMGGASNEVCALTGALAEHAFGIPEKIQQEAKNYFARESLELITDFESKAKGLGSRKSDKQEMDNTFGVIRQGQKTPIYVIPEGRMDMEEAVRRTNASAKRDTLIIRPAEVEGVLNSLALRTNAKGEKLSGTFIDNERPEYYTLWLQDGKIKSSSTRQPEEDEKIPSLATRADNVNKFEELKSYINGIRTELEHLAGHDGPGHIHFESAYYPVVKNRSIDLMQGDILRGRVELDWKGRIAVNTNIATGTNMGEYLEGVLNSMDVFHKNDGVAEIKQKFNEYCLDIGKVEDEDERIALQTDDANADAIRMKYKSNVEVANLDMGRTLVLDTAVAPALTKKESKRLEKLAEIREESKERYEGKSRQDVIDSTRHQGSVFTIGHSNYSAEEFQSLLKRFGIDTVIDIRSFAKSSNYPHFNGETLKKDLSEKEITYIYSGKEMGGHIYRKGEDRFNLYLLESESRKPEYHLFHNQDECLTYCKAQNKTLPEASRYNSFMAMTDEQIQEFVTSKECQKEFAREIEVYTGKNLTYEESMTKEGFKEALKGVRELTKEGHRVAVMCSEGDPECCHRFSMVGYALAHPADGRIKPIDVQHITRKGILLSQDYLEKKVIKAMALTEDPNGLSKAMHKKCISNLTQTKDERRIKITKKDNVQSRKR